LFYFEVYCTEGCYQHAGGLIGGGYIVGMDDEAAFIAANKQWDRHHPQHEIHVEQISAEQYRGVEHGAPHGG
jgi:hypothetical protein